MSDTSRDVDEVPSDAPKLIKLMSGFLDPDTGMLFDKVKVRDIGGDEEDILADKSVPFRVRLEAVMAGCALEFLPSDEDKEKHPNVESISSQKGILRAVEGLTAYDRTAMLIDLRSISPGPWFHFETKCPNRVPQCGAMQTKSVLLSEMPRQIPEDVRLREYEVTISKGRVVKMRVMLGAHEEQLEKLTDDGHNLFTAALLVRIVSIDGEKPTLKSVKALNSADRNKLRWAVSKREGKIDTSIVVKCASCGYEYEEEVTVGSFDFFFPSEMHDPLRPSSDSGSKRLEALLRKRSESVGPDAG